jgi:hypothetical protein
MCTECSEPCFPGLARNRMSFVPAGQKEFVHGYFHLQCFPRFITRLLREHRDLIKKAAKA